MTHDSPSQLLSIARLIDVRVDRRVEDRGIGSMLVKEAIAECKRRGNKGIYGDLSIADKDYFPKLEHFYEKLGFSVVFYEKDHPADGGWRVGKIEMLFEDGPAG